MLGERADRGGHARQTSGRGRTVGKRADWRTSGWGRTVEDGFLKGKTPKLMRQLTWRPKSNVAVLW